MAVAAAGSSSWNDNTGEGQTQIFGAPKLVQRPKVIWTRMGLHWFSASDSEAVDFDARPPFFIWTHSQSPPAASRRSVLSSVKGGSSVCLNVYRLSAAKPLPPCRSISQFHLPLLREWWR